LPRGATVESPPPREWDAGERAHARGQATGLAQPPAPLIRIRALKKRYRMGDSIVRALDGVDLDIHSGEFVAIIGPSGSGKSTMMHLLGCLDRPTEGSFVLDGRDVSTMSEGALARIRNKKIGFVFQTFNLIQRVSALENVAVPLFYARKANTHGAARKALERVGLAHRAHHKPNELSGGERQRVAIARAIVNDPLLLMADEPTGNLDTKTGEQIMDVFHKLNREGVTIVLVTHEMDIALQARRIVQMRDGKIIADRPAEEVAKVWGMQMPTPGVRAGASHAEHAAEGDDGRGDEAPCGDGLHDPALPARQVAGTKRAMVLGLMGPALAFAAWYASGVAREFHVPGAEIPSPEEIKWGMLAAGALLGGFLCGILAIVLAVRALRRIRREPGCWIGKGRARLALALGCAGMLAPFVMMAASRAMR
jgi:putative ABC transport system ATP-binding protein